MGSDMDAATGKGLDDRSLLLDRVVEDLVKWEGAIPWMYRDSVSAGNVTVGVGVMLPDKLTAQKLKFKNLSKNRNATQAEVGFDFDRVRMMPVGLRAAAYRDSNNRLELLFTEVFSLAKERLVTVFIPSLRNIFPRFDSFPDQVKMALIDMIWNLGPTGLRKFSNLVKYCKAGNWEGASRCCNRKTSRDARNDWTRNLFLSGAIS